MRRAYHLLDVFTDAPLTGNPLAVVLDAEDLDDARMQAIAREFNLPETVFVRDPRDPVNSAALRIFTPVRELPFAGHPTVSARSEWSPGFAIHDLDSVDELADAEPADFSVGGRVVADGIRQIP